MLDINQVALFVEVVRGGSFAGAARRLKIPSNTVSRRIADLERALGARLLQRSTRKLSLTTAGQALYEQAAAPVEALERAALGMLNGGGEAIGLVRVTAPADFFEFFKMDYIKEFLSSYPKVQLEFLLSDARVDLIVERVDLAFRGGDLPDSNYTARKLIESLSFLAASPELIGAFGMPRELKDLENLPCIGHALERLIWRFDDDVGTKEVEVRANFMANTAVTQKKACLAGLGVAFLPYAVVREELASGKLVRVLPGHQRTHGGMYAVLPSRRMVPLAVTRFLDFAVEKLRLSLGSCGGAAA